VFVVWPLGWAADAGLVVALAAAGWWFGWVCGLGLIWFAYLILDREAFLIYLFDLETL
jgi:hypothetical protein